MSDSVRRRPVCLSRALLGVHKRVHGTLLSRAARRRTSAWCMSLPLRAAATCRHGGCARARADPVLTPMCVAASARRRPGASTWTTPRGWSWPNSGARRALPACARACSGAAQRARRRNTNKSAAAPRALTSSAWRRCVSGRKSRRCVRLRHGPVAACSSRLCWQAERAEEMAVRHRAASDRKAVWCPCRACDRVRFARAPVCSSRTRRRRRVWPRGSGAWPRRAPRRRRSRSAAAAGALPSLRRCARGGAQARLDTEVKRRLEDAERRRQV